MHNYPLFNPAFAVQNTTPPTHLCLNPAPRLMDETGAHASGAAMEEPTDDYIFVQDATSKPKPPAGPLPHIAAVKEMEAMGTRGALAEFRRQAAATAAEGRAQTAAGAGGATSGLTPGQDASKGIIGGTDSLEQSLGVSLQSKVHNQMERLLDAEQISKDSEELKVARPSWDLSILDFMGAEVGYPIFPFFLININNEAMPPVSEPGMGPYLRILDPAATYEPNPDQAPEDLGKGDSLMDLFARHRDFRKVVTTDDGEKHAIRLPMAAVPMAACTYFPIMASTQEQNDKALCEAWAATLRKEWDAFQWRRVEDQADVKANRVHPRDLVGRYRRFQVKAVDAKANQRRDEVRAMAAQLHAAKTGDAKVRGWEKKVMAKAVAGEATSTAGAGAKAKPRYLPIREMPPELLEHPGDDLHVWVSVIPDSTADPDLIDPELRAKLRPFNDTIDRPLVRIYPFLFPDLKVASDRKFMTRVLGDKVQDVHVLPWALRDLKCVCRWQKSQLRMMWRNDIQHGVMDEFHYGEKAQVASYHEKCAQMGFNPMVISTSGAATKQDLSNLPRAYRKKMKKMQRNAPVARPPPPPSQIKTQDPFERAIRRVTAVHETTAVLGHQGLVPKELFVEAPPSEPGASTDGAEDSTEHAEDSDLEDAEVVARYRARHPEVDGAAVASQTLVQGKDGKVFRKWTLDLNVDGLTAADVFLLPSSQTMKPDEHEEPKTWKEE